METDLEKDVKTNGFFSQIVQKISDLEEFVRSHKAIQHGGSSGGSSAGWTAETNTWTFSSADAPIYVVSVNADMTAVISVGMRIRLVHNAATKYFIVHAVGAFSAGATLLTLYGGTTYTLSATAITATYYSSEKVPFGFPANPDNWTVSATSTSNCTVATPAANTWYGGALLTPAGPSIAVPIGSWLATKDCVGFVIITIAAIGAISIRTTLSNANNTESDNEFHSITLATMPIGTVQQFSSHWRQKIITVSVKTTYFVNVLTGATGATNISLRGDIAKTIIKLVSAYL